MGCYLEDYRPRVGAWPARASWRSAVGKVGKGGSGNPSGPKILSATVIATLLIIGGVELNPGPEENPLQVLCNGVIGVVFCVDSAYAESTQNTSIAGKRIKYAFLGSTYQINNIN